MNVSGEGGVFGSAATGEHGGSFGNTDFYNPGSTIIPTYLGMYKRGGKVKGKKGRRKRRKRSN